MNKQEFKAINEKITLFYGLKEKMETKLKRGEIWSNVDKHELRAIRNSCLQAIIDIMNFCIRETTATDSSKCSLIQSIQSDIKKVFHITDPDKITISHITAIMPAIHKLNQYIHDQLHDQESTADDSQKDSLKESSSSFAIEPITKTVDTSSHISSKKHTDQPVTPISHDADGISDCDNTGDFLSTNNKRDYLYRLATDRDHLLMFINISEEITEDNYEDVLEAYRDYLLVHEERESFERMLNRRVRYYTAYCIRTGKKHWKGEAMLFLRKLFMSENKEKQPAIFIIRKQELEKQSEAEKETLRKQSAYFPQVISLLKQFKKNFSSTYFSLPSANIRDAFLQQYEISVVQPIIHMDPALFGKEDVHNLHHKHWKYELYIGIPSIIRNGSDMLIQAGVTQGFIFGEINDLIDQLQKIYDENNT